MERWRKSLDKKGYGGAMDLSKAFDTVNHGSLIAKLHAGMVLTKDLKVTA